MESSSFKGGPRRSLTIMISNQVQFEYEKEIRRKDNAKIKISKYVNTLLEEMGLVDIWRNLHPLEKDFT